MEEPDRAGTEATSGARSRLRRLRKFFKWLGASVVAVCTVFAALVALVDDMDRTIEVVDKRLFEHSSLRLAQFSLASETYVTVRAQERLNREGEIQEITRYEPRGCDKNGPVRSCRAIFQITLQNKADREILVTQIKYHIEKAIVLWGEGAGPRIPTANYVMVLDFPDAADVQVGDLVPPFAIPPKIVGRFSPGDTTARPRHRTNASFLDVARNHFDRRLSGN